METNHFVNLLDQTSNYSHHIKNFRDFFVAALKHADPRSTPMPLVWQDPTYVLVLASLYLLFVIFGTKYMKTREAFKIPTWFLVAYNGALVVLSAYMCIEVIIGAYESRYNFLCSKLDRSTKPSEMRVLNALWLYFFSKAIEFLDTVWMILRKKFIQVTFLHVFHHSTMLLIWWVTIQWIPTGYSAYGAIFNSFVHVVMYAYYALSLIPSMKNYLWWKKYITTLQLAQFVTILLHTAQGIYFKCDYPQWGLWMLFGYMIIMLILFGNFYINEYINKSNDAKRKQQQKSNDKKKAQ
jgi:hypothetical protein